MPVKITSTKDAAESANICVYGEAGVGKTTLISTAPDPLIISAERGLLSLAKFDLPVAECSSAEDVADVFVMLSESDEAKKTYKTICIDSLSEIAEVVLSEYKKEFTDARQAYGKMADNVANMIRNFRDLPGYNTYFSAKERRIVDELTGKISYIPSVPGKSLNNDLPYLFDEVFCMRIGVDDEGDNFRYLQTQPDRQYTAKDRSGELDPIEYPHLTAVFDKMKGNSAAPEEKPAEQKEDEPEKEEVD